jgi:ATP-dependent helicase/nuclease subunit B
MLRVVTGRFHPHLESALVDRIQEAKSADSFAPLAVFVPSAALRDRIHRLLAVERGLSLLNLHVLTFHQLALRLSEEQRSLDEATPVIRVAGDLFFEQLIRHVVEQPVPALAPLQQLGHSSGTWGALWSTIRDLKDAGVDPARALQGVREGCFGQDDRVWLDALFSLYAAVKEAGGALDAGTPDDLAAALVPFVQRSPFVRSLRGALYYGFYDLTQIQLDFFTAVQGAVPTTLLFPLEPDPAHAFAKRFFERHVLPLAAGPGSVTHLETGRPPLAATSASVSVRSVIGAEEELATVCRTILDLVETNGYRFEDIGVVARTLDPYRMPLQSVFDRHRVPFTCGAGTRLIHEPLCKTLLQLASLPVDDYYRATVLGVLTSPLYSHSCDGSDAVFVRPDLWKLLVPALGITRGRQEWRRLEGAGSTSLEILTEREGEGATEPYGIPPRVTGLLWQSFSRLLTDCDRLPAQGPVSEHIAALTELAARHLRHPSAEDHADEETAGRVHAAWTAVERALDEMEELTVLGETITWAEFVELLTHVMERTPFRTDEAPHSGVAVLDIMTARGIPFKGLFVLGLNEKVFPRYIREDPFLRDRHRQVLDATLGFKIDEKLAGYDEETLLFSLLTSAASHRLYLFHQRADETGRAVAPSPYLGEAARLFRVAGAPGDAVPRRLTDRAARQPGLKQFLPPSELTVWMELCGDDPAPLLRAIGRDADTFLHGRRALRQMEDETPALTSYDGLTGTLAPEWARLCRDGLAPTPLERYARCPFQYFVADVLRLTPVHFPVAEGLDPALLGTFCHAALRYCYESLLPTGWPAEPVTDETVDWCVHSAVERAAGECDATRRTGHYLFWEMTRETVVDLVAAAVESEQAAFAEAPFLPVAFEVDAEGVLPEGITADGKPVKTHGRIDRIDRHRESGALRVIDYKVKMGARMGSDDRNLLQAAVRGHRLQPPLYAWMTPSVGPPPAEVQFFFLAPKWAPPVARSTLARSAWSSAGPLLRSTFTTLLEGLRAGRYFILPDGYCKTCDFRAVCRREHTPSWWRASRAAEATTIKNLRRIKVADE